MGNDFSNKLVECPWCKELVLKDDYQNTHLNSCEAWNEWEEMYWSDS